MDAKTMDNGLYVIGVKQPRLGHDAADYYQVMVADNYIEIRDFTTHAKILDCCRETAHDVLKILALVEAAPCANDAFIDEVME